MEAGFAALLIVTLLFGIVIGMFLGLLRTGRSKTKGIIHVDYSDPEDGPYLFLELNVPVSDIVSRKRVTLDVDVTKYISQK